MKIRIITSLMFIFLASQVHGEISNSTTYKAFYVLDSSGSIANSTNLISVVTVDNTLGISNSVSHISCIGYVCVEFGPLGEIIRVTFLLDLNISGTAGDVTYVDNLTAPGIYTAGSLERVFGCVEDPTITGTPTFGLAFAGSRFSYLRMESVPQTSIRLSQEHPANKFVLPVTTSGCEVIRRKMPLGFPFTPFVPLPEMLDALEIIASYPIDLVGNYESTGSFTLILEKNSQNQIRGIIP